MCTGANDPKEGNVCRVWSHSADEREDRFAAVVRAKASGAGEKRDDNRGGRAPQDGEAEHHRLRGLDERPVQRLPESGRTGAGREGGDHGQDRLVGARSAQELPENQQGLSADHRFLPRRRFGRPVPDSARTRNEEDPGLLRHALHRKSQLPTQFHPDRRVKTHQRTLLRQKQTGPAQPPPGHCRLRRHRQRKVLGLLPRRPESHPGLLHSLQIHRPL